MPFDTPINPAQEGDFLKWKQQYAPYDSGHDYDLRGAFQAGITPDSNTGHWPDTFKKPNHPTFSDQSIYSSLTGTKPGSWQGENYTPFPGTQPSIGYGEQPHPFWKAFEGVVQGLRNQQSSNAPWGMHEPTVMAGEAMGPAAGRIGEVMSDPRNAWMGLGPMSVLGKYGKFFRKPTPDMGGFNVPTSQLSKQDPHMAQLNDLWESEKRQDFAFGRKLENTMADTLLQGKQHPQYAETLDRYRGLNSVDQENVNRVLEGRRALADEVANAMNPHLGGGVPNKYLGYGDGLAGSFARPNTRR